MIRKEILRVLQEAVQREGYSFRTGFSYRIPKTKLAFPVAWAEPMELTRIEGRNAGEVTYQVNLHLMIPDKQYDESRKEEIWGQLEHHMLRIIRRMELKNPIYAIEKIVCAPQEYAHGGQGELSLKTQWEVRATFSNYTYE